MVRWPIFLGILQAMKKYVTHLGADIPAAIVVFLVALPLCLGIALASDALPITGLIAGIVGGIVIGMLSGSQLSVSGPAAGLTAIVASALAKLNAYETFLLAVVIAGLLQLALGFLKAGIVGEFIPNAVIKGMLAAIGLILILKQLPHLVGWDADFEGEESFVQPDNENTFTEIFKALGNFSPGAVIIGLVAVAILLVYEVKAVKKNKISLLVPGPLVAVVSSVLLNIYFRSSQPSLALEAEHLVRLDVFDSPAGFFASLPHPNFGAVANPQVWITALTIAIVASLETLLSVEAIDKIDPQKRITPTNRELKAQGVGNMVSGLLGGLPVTSVIVRSSANLNSGARTKMSCIIHGLLLLGSVLFIPHILNMIPKAGLAAILILTGYKLAKVSIFREYFRKGWDQFIPFVITVTAILLTDLLIGICIGILTGLIFVMRSNFKSGITVVSDETRHLLRFKKEVNFLNKAEVKKTLEAIPDNTALLIDASHSTFIDKDIVEMVNDFIINAGTRGIRIYIKYGAGLEQEFFNTPAETSLPKDSA